MAFLYDFIYNNIVGDYMTKSLLIKVKKFFAIVFSFLFGFLFRKEQKEDDRKDQDIKEESFPTGKLRVIFSGSHTLLPSFLFLRKI